MGSCIVKQPNGLYCRYSSVVDAPTHYNLTKEEVKALLLKYAEDEINDRLLSLEKYPEWGWTFEDVKKNTIVGDNISREQFERFCKETRED